MRLSTFVVAAALFAQAPTISSQLKKDTIALEAQFVASLKATPPDLKTVSRLGRQITNNMLKMQAQCTDAYLVKPVGIPGGSNRDYLCAVKP